MTRVTLSLISHTNVGKTTLVRTLTRSDVGEAYDGAHVTLESTAYPLVSVDGAELVLWDTPGFGDSRRLLERLEQQSAPLSWFLREVWDRRFDKALYCSQEAVRNARDEADVILYLVNAMETPAEAGYVELELQVLDWVGKPVVFVLNQTGAEEPALLEAWTAATSKWPLVRDVLPLDAFTRSWVQEDALLERVARVVPQAKQAAMAKLLAEWKRRSQEVLDRSVQSLARYLAMAQAASEPLASRSKSEVKQAFARLEGRLERATDDLTAELLEAHGLEGKAAGTIAASLENVLGAEAAKAPNKGLWAVVSGVASGAASGLVADVLAGGLTFGGGALIGGVLGGIAGAGAATAYDVFTRGDAEAVRWNPEFLAALAREALLRYLAVAHHGRGRGDFREASEGGRWLADLDAVLAERGGAIGRALERAGGKATDALVDALRQAVAETLERRYGTAPARD